MQRIEIGLNLGDWSLIWATISGTMVLIKLMFGM